MWDPKEPDNWVADAQRWITQIKGVKQCRINLDDQGEIDEVLVVAGEDKAPRLIVRDIETLLNTRLDAGVDYKKISVTQLIDTLAKDSAGVTHHDTRAMFESNSFQESIPEESPMTAEPAISQPTEEIPPAPVGSAAPIPAVILAEDIAPRIICTSVALMASDMIIRAEVQLQAAEVESMGSVEGPNHADSDLTLVARAAVDAIAQLLVDPILLHLKEVRLEDLGGQSVVLTAVEVVEGRRTETHLGACSTRHNRQQAVVHSVLDALNRRLSITALKPPSPGVQP